MEPGPFGMKPALGQTIHLERSHGVLLSVKDWSGVNIHGQMLYIPASCRVYSTDRWRAGNQLII